jgi:hypothetical protein
MHGACPKPRSKKLCGCTKLELVGGFVGDLVVEQCSKKLYYCSIFVASITIVHNSIAEERLSQQVHTRQSHQHSPSFTILLPAIHNTTTLYL